MFAILHLPLWIFLFPQNFFFRKSVENRMCEMIFAAMIHRLIRSSLMITLGIML